MPLYSTFFQRFMLHFIPLLSLYRGVPQRGTQLARPSTPLDQPATYVGKLKKLWLRLRRARRSVVENSPLFLVAANGCSLLFALRPFDEAQGLHQAHGLRRSFVAEYWVDEIHHKIAGVRPPAGIKFRVSR